MQKKMSFVELVESFVRSDEFVLPVFSSAALKVQHELVQKEPDMKAVISTISGEQALSSKVLQLANSSFYKGLTEVTTIQAAAVRLGMEEIGRISLLAAAQDQFRSSEKDHVEIMKKLWQHAVGCAMGARWLAQRCDLASVENEAFFAGLFHDVGKLVVLMVFEQLRRKHTNTEFSGYLLSEAMRSLHCEQGCRLMERWNIPEKYQNIARDHHREDDEVKDLLLCLVRVANMTCNKLAIGVEAPPEENIAAIEESIILNLTELDLAELEIKLEDAKILSS